MSLKANLFANRKLKYKFELIEMWVIVIYLRKLINLIKIVKLMLKPR